MTSGTSSTLERDSGLVTSATLLNEQNAALLAGRADVRLKFLEASRKEATLEAMNLARHVAEAVCTALTPAIPSGRVNGYRSGDLHTRISILEDQSKAGEEPRLPKAVLAGLRTLQAFGNYAAHYEVGTHKPPVPATRSAMNSLALVARWFLEGSLSSSEEAEEDRYAISVLPKSPHKPGLIARWKLRRRIPAVPELEVGNSKCAAHEGKFEISTTADARTQLKYLDLYLEAASGVACEIARVILERETTISSARLSQMGLEELSIALSRLGDERPLVLPRVIWADLEELKSQNALVQLSIQGQTAEAAHILVNVRQRDLARGLMEWFEREYLARTAIERKALKWAAIAAAVYYLLYLPVQDGGKTTGREELARDLSGKYCAQAPETGGSGICTDLATILQPPEKKD